MRLHKSIPALLLGLALVAGCDSLGLGGSSPEDSGNKNDRISGNKGRTRDRGENDGTVMKYPSDFDNGIPTGAHLAREVDTNGSASYKAAHDGKLYVYDVDSRRVVWSGAIRDGERFTLDTRGNRASINGQSVLNRDVNPDHQYRLYFGDDYGNNSNLNNSTRTRDNNLDNSNRNRDDTYDNSTRSRDRSNSSNDDLR
jgi:hypothetical protein